MQIGVMGFAGMLVLRCAKGVCAVPSCGVERGPSGRREGACYGADRGTAGLGHNRAGGVAATLCKVWPTDRQRPAVRIVWTRAASTE